MSIIVPILTELKSNGIEKAINQFKELEGAGEKAQFAIKKAAVPAAAALGGLAAALGDSVKAAMEDQAAQIQLNRTLRDVAGLTDFGVKATEDWIDATSRAKGVTDDELRPALSRLVTQTKDVGVAERGVYLAMDIAAATGKDLSTVTGALEKAYGGNTKALAKLSPELKGMISDGMGLDDALGVLEGTFAGASDAAANSAEGGMKRFGIAMSETKENIGAALLPAVEKLQGPLTALGDWAQNHTTTFLVLSGAIGGIATAVLAVNTAMKVWSAAQKIATALQWAWNVALDANPIGLIVIGIAALIAGIVLAYKKFEWFRTGINAVVNGVIGYFEFLINAWIMVINGIIRAWNIVPGHKDIKTIEHITLGRVGQDSGAAGGGSTIPKMADGGIVTAPTLALIGERGPEAVIPLNRANGMGVGGGVTINVNGGDPQAVVNALRRYMQQNGSVPIRVAG